MKITAFVATMALLAAARAAPIEVAEANIPKPNPDEHWRDDKFRYYYLRKHQVSLKRYSASENTENQCAHETFVRGYTLFDGKCKTFKNEKSDSPDLVAYWIPEMLKGHQKHCEITFYEGEKCRGAVSSFLTTEDQTFDRDDPGDLTCRKTPGAKSALMTCAETWDGLLKKGGSPWLHPDSNEYEGPWEENYYTSETGGGAQGVWNRLKCRWNKHRHCDIWKWNKKHANDEINKW